MSTSPYGSGSGILFGPTLSSAEESGGLGTRLKAGSFPGNESLVDGCTHRAPVRPKGKTAKNSPVSNPVGLPIRTKVEFCPPDLRPTTALLTNK